MLGLGNILTRGIGPVEPYTGGITNRWPARDNGYTSNSLLDTVGGNHINTTLGQALDFDGVLDAVQTGNSDCDFIHGATKLTIAATVQLDTGTTGSIAIGGTSNGTIDCLLRTLSSTSGHLRLYLTTTAGTIIYTTNTGSHFALGTTFSVVISLDLANPDGAISCHIKRLDVASPAWTANLAMTNTGTANTLLDCGTINLSATAANRRMIVGAYATGTGAISSPWNGDIHQFVIGTFHDVSAAKAMLDSHTRPTGQNYLGLIFDQQSSPTTAASFSGGTAAVSAINLRGAPSYVNGTHRPYFPQKGFGGGAYTGGLGATVLYTYGTGGDADPGSGISADEFRTLGSSFTFDGWIYKPAAILTSGETFISTVDATAGIARRGFWLRSHTDFTSAKLTVYGATGVLESDITLAMNDDLWWYFAIVHDAGKPTLYLAQPSASSLTSAAGVDVGSATAVATEGVNNLYIMARYHPSGTQNNASAGTRIDDLVYHAGVALTSAQLLERFNYNKARYL